jgi:hypothetical protein
LVPLFAVTLFVSAALLFLVQPMVGRMILPTLGGTPAVWNTCMVFFQAVLLAGYAYSHASVKLLGVRRQAAFHMILLLVPLAVLPISVAQGVIPPTNDNPAPWLLWQLLLFVGAPFFVLSTGGPLLQRWFAQTGHRDAKDPYFLYAVSNLGSLLALLGYPLLVEPRFALQDQSKFWAIGYIVLICLIALCGLTLLRRSALPFDDFAGQVASENEPAQYAPDFSRRLWWILLSAVPSSLMLGVTSYITTDLAAIPLFWVLPLALYLLTMVMAFARKPLMSLRTLSLLLPAILPLWLITLVPLPVWVMVGCHLSVFFLVALMCHSRLAASRPPAKYLTEFYLWMSVGGLLGGFFNAFAAPLIFNRVIEYHLMLALACLLKPPINRISTDKSAAGQIPGDLSRSFVIMDLAAPIAMFAAAMGIILSLKAMNVQSAYPARFVAYLLIPFACFFFRNRPVRFGMGFAALLIISGYLLEQGTGTTLHRERNFYGVKHVRLNQDGTFRELVHGGITHGVQSTDPALSREPFAYYHRSGPVGDVFAVAQRKPGGRRVAVIGLGSGAMAAYAEAGDTFKFYEIDPAVARLAEDGRFFSYLPQCRGTYSIVLGDGRQTLSRTGDQYDLILVDAFSSDSIPIHLICRESIQLYLSKLSEKGILAFHLSNLYLNLEPVLGNLATDAGLAALVRYHRVDQESAKKGIFPSCYMVMARKNEDLVKFDTANWKTPVGDPGKAVWSDQYCNVLSTVRWH